MATKQDPFEGEMTTQDVRSLGGTDAPAQPKPAVQQKPAVQAQPKAPPAPKNGTTLTGEPADQVVINPNMPEMNEAKAHEKHAVFAFGRFNPLTVGHEKLIHAVENKAKEVGGEAHIVASHSQGTARDPLPQDAKVKYLGKVAGKGTHVTGSSKAEPTFLQYAAKLHKQGVTHLHMVAGSDRVKEYQEKLTKYNGGHEGSLFNFKHTEVHSAGQRDPDAEGVEGMSGTKMRAAAREGDMKTFKSGLPKSLQKHAEEIADHIRSIKEHALDEAQPLVEAVVSLQQRMRRAIAMRKNKARLTRARNIARKRMAGKGQLSRRAMKRAKNILRQRLAGSQGAKYKNLSKAQKIAVDKMVERRKKAIKRIALKIAPRIRSDELKRLSAVQHGTSFKSSRMPVVASFELTDKEDKYLMEKAEATGINYQTLLQVFNRGKVAWTKDQPPGKTPSQYAFNRLNSFVQGGKAFKEDKDLREAMGTTVRDILAKGMHTARMMDKVNPEHVPAVHPGHMQAAAKKGEDEVVARRKRAALIRTKTKEYVTKVVDEQRTNTNIVAPSLKEAVEKMLGGCGCQPEEDYIYEEMSWEDWIMSLVEENNEGRALNKPFRTPGGPKKFAVYVKNDKGNVIKLGFGDPNLEIKRDDPDRRKAYRARHGCDNPGPKWKANYWSCNWSWSASKKVGA